jgi:hypothetical protein
MDLNSSLSEDLTFEQVKQFGVDTSMIAVCRKLRRLAKLDRLKIDDTQHWSGLNKHLFDYVNYCGRNMLDFVKSYLSNIQPYMIERKKDQEHKDTFICVIDNLYRISVYIKVDMKQFEEIIISFHEDNKRGVARTNDVLKIDNRRIVPIFADQVLAKLSNENKYSVKAIFQRGLLELPLDLVAVKCQDIFLVDMRAINNLFISYCNDYIRDLYASDLNLDFNTISVFSMLQQISFTSYGKDTFSSISLLIDSFSVQQDPISRGVADYALITFAQNLQLTAEQRNELVNLLNEKFKVTSIKGIDLILQRVEENLCILNNGEVIKTSEF